MPICSTLHFIIYDLEVYCGKQRPAPSVLSNKPFDVVVRLIQGIKNTNRNVTIDSYLTLAEYLLDIGSLGTIRKNKEEIPPKFMSVNNNSVPMNYSFGCQDDKTLVL